MSSNAEVQPPQSALDVAWHAIDMSESLQRIARGDVGSWASYRARESFATLRLSTAASELLCLPMLPNIEQHWYQIETAKKVLGQLGGRALLGDEVGLGKTIEACLICKEYLTRGMIRSLLVLTPATLVSQWQRELHDKFSIETVTTDQRDGEPEVFWHKHPRIVASMATAKSKHHFNEVTRRKWDMVVIDEAHHLKNRTTLNWKLANALDKRFVLMLTATPVQNHLIELYNLLTVLKPGLLQTEAEFRQRYVHSKNPRHPKRPEDLRRLMREVMVRNTRSLVDVQLPKRFASTVVVQPSEQERTIYEEVSALVREAGGLKLHRSIQVSLLSRAASSMSSLPHALQLMAGGKLATHPGTQRICKAVRGLKVRSKLDHLVHLLSENQDKVLVFVNHRDTQEEIGSRLAQEHISHALFHGSMSLSEKDAAVQAFRSHARVLVATETGGEGRNLQFANTLINFDLPWNPMRIEQRIGRVHRIGQKRDVFILNLCLAGTLEEYLLQILHDKINMFELVVGEVDAILGTLEEDFDLSETILQLWRDSDSAPARAKAFAALGDRLIGAKEAFAATQAMEQEIFGDELEV